MYLFQNCAVVPRTYETAVIKIQKNLEKDKHRTVFSIKGRHFWTHEMHYMIKGEFHLMQMMGRSSSPQIRR
jgi:hypothetical protein